MSYYYFKSFNIDAKKRLNTRSKCDFIQPYFKYNYMNNTL